MRLHTNRPNTTEYKFNTGFKIITVLLYLSVKQKLFHLMKVKSEGVDEVSESIDNTLHSTSPIPENEQIPLQLDSRQMDIQQVSQPSQTQHVNSRGSSPGQVDSGGSSPGHVGSGGSSPGHSSKIPSLIRSNSYTLERPSVALLISERVSIAAALP